MTKMFSEFSRIKIRLQSIVQLINILSKLAQFIIHETNDTFEFRRSQLIIFSLLLYKANLFILSLLLSGMISAYTPHKFIRAFPQCVYNVVTLP